MVFEKVLIKKFSIQKEKGWLYTHANKQHKWGERAILSFFFIALMYLVYVNSIHSSFFTLPPYFFILYSYRTFMEWKYQRGTRKYILTIYTLLFIELGYLCLYHLFGII
ncbi:DUF4181 domain-containing protein [Peribacillus loiseleuriae]|uniref:DUF4181 domain-containing protein n=1 Tax=Peribacillus loiseleuriae TaxID=1679170 RepID=UPI003CCBB743